MPGFVFPVRHSLASTALGLAALSRSFPQDIRPGSHLLFSLRLCILLLFLFSLTLHRSFSFPPSRRVVCRSISSPFHPLRFFFDTVSRGWLLRLVRVDFWHRSPHADHGRRFSVAFLRVVFGSRVCTCVAVCAAGVWMWVCACVCSFSWEALCDRDDPRVIGE